jgi:nucleotide-binding universal stress UspA family protein
MSRSPRPTAESEAPSDRASRSDVSGGATSALFHSPLCGIDESGASVEAARQAALITDPAGSALLFSVAHGPGRSGQPGALTAARARRAVREARRTLASTGLECRKLVIERRDVAPALLRAAGHGYDLLAVAAHNEPRRVSIALSRISALLAHKAPVPVLLARRPPDEMRFPDHILISCDGSPDSLRAAELAGAIASRHGSRVSLVHVGASDNTERRPALAEAAVRITEATGTEPVTIEEPGRLAHEIVEVARRERCSLIVIGSRGLTGIRALDSVSERVASAAPCSVLIARLA